eukprot:567674_1
MAMEAVDIPTDISKNWKTLCEKFEETRDIHSDHSRSIDPSLGEFSTTLNALIKSIKQKYDQQTISADDDSFLTVRLPKLADNIAATADHRIPSKRKDMEEVLNGISNFAKNMFQWELSLPNTLSPDYEFTESSVVEDNSSLILDDDSESLPPGANPAKDGSNSEKRSTTTGGKSATPTSVGVTTRMLCVMCFAFLVYTIFHLATFDPRRVTHCVGLSQFLASRPNSAYLRAATDNVSVWGHVSVVHSATGALLGEARCTQQGEELPEWTIFLKTATISNFAACIPFTLHRGFVATDVINPGASRKGDHSPSRKGDHSPSVSHGDDATVTCTPGTWLTVSGHRVDSGKIQSRCLDGHWSVPVSSIECELEDLSILKRSVAEIIRRQTENEDTKRGDVAVLTRVQLLTSPSTTSSSIRELEASMLVNVMQRSSNIFVTTSNKDVSTQAQIVNPSKRNPTRISLDESDVVIPRNALRFGRWGSATRKLFVVNRFSTIAVKNSTAADPGDPGYIAAQWTQAAADRPEFRDFEAAAQALLPVTFPVSISVFDVDDNDIIKSFNLRGLDPCKPIEIFFPFRNNSTFSEISGTLNGPDPVCRSWNESSGRFVPDLKFLRLDATGVWCASTHLRAHSAFFDVCWAPRIPSAEVVDKSADRGPTLTNFAAYPKGPLAILALTAVSLALLYVARYNDKKAALAMEAKPTGKIRQNGWLAYGNKVVRDNDFLWAILNDPIKSKFSRFAAIFGFHLANDHRWLAPFLHTRPSRLGYTERALVMIASGANALAFAAVSRSTDVGVFRGPGQWMVAGAVAAISGVLHAALASYIFKNSRSAKQELLVGKGPESLVAKIRRSSGRIFPREMMPSPTVSPVSTPPPGSPVKKSQRRPTRFDFSDALLDIANDPLVFDENGNVPRDLLGRQSTVTRNFYPVIRKELRAQPVSCDTNEARVFKEMSARGLDYLDAEHKSSGYLVLKRRFYEYALGIEYHSKIDDPKKLRYSHSSSFRKVAYYLVGSTVLMAIVISILCTLNFDRYTTTSYYDCYKCAESRVPDPTGDWLLLATLAVFCDMAFQVAILFVLTVWTLCTFNKVAVCLDEMVISADKPNDRTIV